MKKTFEKILDRLEEKKQYFQKFYETDGKTEEDENINKATQLAFDDAKSIVKEVAEEYNGGWIPCSERLPELEIEVLICTRERGMTIASLTKPDIFWEDEQGNILEDVVAWQQLPEPYQQKGEQQ